MALCGFLEKYPFRCFTCSLLDFLSFQSLLPFLHVFFLTHDANNHSREGIEDVLTNYAPAYGICENTELSLTTTYVLQVGQLCRYTDI